MPNAPKQTAPVHNLRATYPKSSIPLNEIGQESYDYWCTKLTNAGLLSAIARQHAENLALAKDDLALAKAAGKLAPKAASELLKSATLKLERLVGNFDLDDEAETRPKGENRFAAFGFARRAGQRRHGNG